MDSPSISPKEGAYRTEEESRYDRSTRLWGAQAQQLLRDGHVLLLGATSTGSETLKNMALPGLGNFTIVDGARVGIRDFGRNFFLEQSDLGAPRALAVARLIRELNPLVSGQGVEQDPNEFALSLAAKSDVGDEGLRRFSVILATSQVRPDVLMKLADAAIGKGVPIVHVLALGFTGVLRIQSDPRHLTNIAPDPEQKVEDMRPFAPFPALKAFIDRLDPDDPAMDDETHAHLPWFVIAHYAVKKWRRVKGFTDESRLPTAMEWRGVKDIIMGMMRPKPGGAVEDNFVETKDMCGPRLIIQNRGFPELNAVLADPKAAAPGPDDDVFWFLVHGLKRFRETNDGLMPLPGDIPDFHTSTQLYRELQGIFRRKGEEDAAAVRHHAVDALHRAGRHSREITEQVAAEFAAHAWELNAICYPPLSARIGANIDLSAVKSKSDRFTQWYVAHTAALRFAQAHGRLPGECREDLLQDDVAALTELSLALTGSAEFVDGARDVLAEIVRSGGAEIIPVASILGAVAAQECIKLIQNRRVPICHSLVYDGIANEFGTVQ